MKTYSYKTKYHTTRALLISILMVSGFSCQDLEEDVSGVLVADSFYQTESDLDAGVIAAYREFTRGGFSAFGSTNMLTPLMGADDISAKQGGNKLDFYQFDVFAASSTNGRLKGSSWQRPYNAIYAANTVLENYQTVKGDETVINQSVAQARFLRALAYFWMVQLYGDLPLVESAVPDTDLTRSPVSEVYELILEDLQFAETHLPASWEEAGRPTVWAAKSLLAKVYLTMAGWPLKQTSNYALAAAKAKEVIDGSPHALLADFADLWPIDNQNNIEQIFSIQFCNTVDCGWGYFSTMTGRSGQPVEEGGWDDYYAEIGFFNQFPEGPRKDATFHTEFVQGDGTTISWDDPNTLTKHPYYAKYRSGGIPGEPGFEHRNRSSRNFVIMRYAEVLLIYAEAQAMSGSPNAESYEYVNQVRRRALGLPIGTPDAIADLTPGLGQTGFVDAVIGERAWEFACEMVRWFDLVRTEKVEESITSKDPEDNQPVGAVTKNQYLAPIPESERLLNPNLDQNEGY